MMTSTVSTPSSSRTLLSSAFSSYSKRPSDSSSSGCTTSFLQISPFQFIAFAVILLSVLSNSLFQRGLFAFPLLLFSCMLFLHDLAIPSIIQLSITIPHYCCVSLHSHSEVGVKSTRTQIYPYLIVYMKYSYRNYRH